MPSDNLFKDNIWMYIKSLAKEFRKQNRNIPYTELIIVGGGSILLNYSFRDMTTDVDAFSTADEAMKTAASVVAAKMNISSEWINNDFLKTDSFSSKLREVSKRYALLNNGTFDVRTVQSEYLIAMKLNSNREYKNDFSDVVGILMNEKENGNDISFEKIFAAYDYLYNNQKPLSEELKVRVQTVCSMAANELHALYSNTRIDEQSVRTVLLRFDEQYPDTLSQANVRDIIKMLKNR